MQPRLAFAQRLVQFGSTVVTGIFARTPLVSAASAGLSHCQPPTNLSLQLGEGKHHSLCPHPTLCCCSIPPGSAPPSALLSLPSKLNPSCNDQAKTHSQKLISVIQAQRGAVNTEHDDLYSVGAEVHTRAQYYH